MGTSLITTELEKSWVLRKPAIETYRVNLLARKTILKNLEYTFPVICPGVNKSKRWCQRPDLFRGGHLGHFELENGNQLSQSGISSYDQIWTTAPHCGPQD